MVESALTQLSRAWKQTVFPTFKRNSLLNYFTAEPIGDQSVTEWAQKVLKKSSDAHLQKFGSGWNAPVDTFNFEDMRFEIYEIQKRIKMNSTELAFFQKHGILPAGLEDMVTRMADKGNYALWRGPKDGDQFEAVSAQYNYFIDTGTGSGTVARPLPITAASAAVKWDAAGGAQKDAAKLAGLLKKLGKSPGMSVVFYPEVCAEVFERPVVTGSSIYGDVNVAEMIRRHGFIDVIPIKDEYMYTAGNATPTVEAFDMYAIHLPDIRIGYSVDLNTEAIYDPVDKLHYLDMQIAFCPLKVPILYDGDSKYYSGVARVTACDANT